MHTLSDLNTYRIIPTISCCLNIWLPGGAGRGALVSAPQRPCQPWLLAASMPLHDAHGHTNTDRMDNTDVAIDFDCYVLLPWCKKLGLLLGIAQGYAWQAWGQYQLITKPQQSLFTCNNQSGYVEGPEYLGTAAIDRHSLCHIRRWTSSGTQHPVPLM